MGKWTPERNDVVWGGDTPRCVSADKYNDATEIVTRHNSDIVALTARAEAAERALALSEQVRSISVRADAYEQKCRQLEAAEKRLASVLDRVGFYVSDMCYCDELDGDRCEHCDFLRDLRRFAKGDGATEIVTRHNPDIDAMTARAEAAEAERDELRRRLEAVLSLLEPGKRPEPEEYQGYDQLFRERLCRWKDTVKRYERAKAIAERCNDE